MDAVSAFAVEVLEGIATSPALAQLEWNALRWVADVLGWLRACVMSRRMTDSTIDDALFAIKSAAPSL